MATDDRDLARAELLELYRDRFEAAVSDEAAVALLLELLNDPQTRPLVLRAYPEVADVWPPPE